MESLKSSKAFNRVYRQGTPRFGKYLVLSTLPNGRPASRVGFAVSKKVGNAVTRNKIKRRLRAIVREISPGISGGCDVVIGAKRSSSGASFAELRADLYRLMQGSGLLTRNLGGGDNA
ncbi:MAG TPA: ribonuclease P protein component [Firmicutes bacterium]|nr:ribonuclease P protein component [Bacillota bacterium]